MCTKDVCFCVMIIPKIINNKFNVSSLSSVALINASFMTSKRDKTLYNDHNIE